MSKITALTPEQQQRLPLFRAQYLAHGINTAPADRARAESAFHRAYAAIGKSPVPVMWVDSPLTASLAFAALKHLSVKENSDSLWASLRASLRVSLGDSLRVSLRASLGVSLRDSLRASLRASLGVSLGDSKINPQFTYWWGQQDLYWVAFYKFCEEIGVPFGDTAKDHLDIMHEIGLSCMWWYPRDGLIIACERPSKVHLNEREQLHNDNGPAVAFRDGWEIYAVHGVRIPGWIVSEPNRLTPAAIEAEQNSEIKRVMVERYGWDRYILDIGGTVVDHDERWGTLLRTSAGMVLEVVNRSPEPDGSFRQYILPVADQCEPLPDPADQNGALGEPQELTALNAVASTFGLTGTQYIRLLSAES